MVEEFEIIISIVKLEGKFIISRLFWVKYRQMKCCSLHGVVEVSRAHAGLLWGLLTETECSLCCCAPAPVA